jgi:hypothetical protein
MPYPAIVDVANRKTSDQVSDELIGKNSANVLNFIANGVILPARVVKFDTGAQNVIGSVLAADLHIGVYVGYLNSVIGDQVPIAVDGVCLAEAGGAVTQGQMLSTDTVGRVVTAATTNRLIGKALQSGVLGDKIKIVIADHSLVV